MTHVRQVGPRRGLDVEPEVDIDADGSPSSHGVEARSLKSPQGPWASDLPVAAATSPNRHADKITSLLASYYDVGDDGDGGLEVEEIQPTEAGDDARRGAATTSKSASYTTSPPSPPSNDDMLSHIKSNQRLDDLMTTVRELATDIGNADIELRGVVYDSYCAFIKASETVHSLHTALHDVDASLHQLDTLLSSVAENSDTIDHRLSAQQRVIFELHEKRTVSQGVEALLKVGERMREELDAGDYDQVVSLYRGSVEALDAFGEYGAVERVRSRVAELRYEAVQVLRERLKSDRNDGSAGTVLNDRKVLTMLVGLGEAREGLLEAYLGQVQSDMLSMRSSTASDVSMWDVVAETIDVCRAVILPHAEEDTDRDGANVSPIDKACEGALDAFVADSVRDIVQPGVNGPMEVVLAALAASGGFDVSGAEHPDSDQHQQREAYGAALPGMFESFDALLRHAREVDALRANSGDGVATSVALHAIYGALDQHVRASYAVVGARALKSIKEMMMRLLLADGDDVRFLRVLIKSLEVNAKQDFGLVEKTVEAWVAWDGCVTKLQVLECLDSGCQDMLSALCDSVGGMVTGDRGQGPITPAGSPAFLQKQFLVPATLSRMDSAAPVAMLCLASSLTVVRSAVVDAELNDTEVATTADGLAARYLEKMTSEIKNVVDSSFASEVLAQVATPPSKPSKTALDVIRVVTQVKADCVSTNRPETTWPTELLNIALKEEMDVIERSKPVSKAAFQQLQVDVAVLKRRLSAELAPDSELDGLVSRAAESCREPALVDPLTLERVAGVQ